MFHLKEEVIKKHAIHPHNLTRFCCILIKNVKKKKNSEKSQGIIQIQFFFSIVVLCKEINSHASLT